MPASSNFQEAIREAQSSALVGPNVVNKALPYVGGGMVLTAAGVLGGIATYVSMAPGVFQMLSFAAIIPWFILFFVAQNAANKANKQHCSATAGDLQPSDGLHAHRSCVACTGGGRSLRWDCSPRNRDHLRGCFDLWSSNERQRWSGAERSRRSPA